MAYPTLTAEQKKVFDEVERTLSGPFENARAKIAAAAFHADKDTLYCTLCSCDEFQHQSGSSTCRRPGCGHSWFRHNVW
jgi:hypothetical protein